LRVSKKEITHNKEKRKKRKRKHKQENMLDSIRFWADFEGNKMTHLGREQSVVDNISHCAENTSNEHEDEEP